MLRRNHAPSRLLLIGLFATALVAAACGDGDSTDALAPGGGAQTTATVAAIAETTAAPAAAEPVEQGLTLPTPLPEAQSGVIGDGEAPAESVAPQATTTPTVATSATAAPTTAAPTTAAPAANNFPAVAVERIADRAQVTMSDQVGGGTTPVLLWFWSPF